MVNKSEIYKRIFFTKVKEIVPKGDYVRDEWKLLVFYGIKYFNCLDYRSTPSSLGEAQERFELLDIIISFVGMLTPDEFMNIFPVTKKYDGWRCETKDYYSTMEHVNNLDRDELIIMQEEPLQFLYEYDNEDVFEFSVASMMEISNMRKWQGEKTPFEEFCEENNITTYSTINSGSKEYLKNNQTGKIARVSKPLPSHMRVIK